MSTDFQKASIRGGAGNKTRSKAQVAAERKVKAMMILEEERASEMKVQELRKDMTGPRPSMPMSTSRYGGSMIRAERSTGSLDLGTVPEPSSSRQMPGQRQSPRITIGGPRSQDAGAHNSKDLVSFLAAGMLYFTFHPNGVLTLSTRPSWPDNKWVNDHALSDHDIR